MSNLFHDVANDAWRHIHAHPELALEEVETTNYVENIIKEHIEPKRMFRVGDNVGLFVEIEGTGTKGDPERVLALRGDMDALPIEEDTGLAFASKNKGVMHACGHDVHTAALLSALLALDARKDEFAGSIYFFFQPAEEILEGAKLFIEHDDIDFGKIDRAVATHVISQVPAGVVGSRPGPILASSDRVEINVKGYKGHAAQPQLAKDAIVIAAQIVTAIQTLVSREISAVDSAVLTFGQVNGGTAGNIITDHVRLFGTLRTLNPKVREQMHVRIEELAKGIAKSMGGDAEIEIVKGTPPLINDKEVVKDIVDAIETKLPEYKYYEAPSADMGGEDFSYIAELVPSCFIGVGSKIEGEDVTPAHTSEFKTDPEAVIITSNVYREVALRYMTK